jgi:hypothetical protein
VSATADLDAVEKRKIKERTANRTSVPWLSSPQHSHYTDCFLIPYDTQYKRGGYANF